MLIARILPKDITSLRQLIDRTPYRQQVRAFTLSVLSLALANIAMKIATILP
jgi:hypothetical protein